jgi:hypothetical protein
MKYTLEEIIRKDYIIVCETQKEADIYCNAMNELGRTWCSGKSYKENSHFNSFERYGYRPSQNCRGTLKYYKNEGKTIVHLKNVILPTSSMEEFPKKGRCLYNKEVRAYLESISRRDITAKHKKKYICWNDYSYWTSFSSSKPLYNETILLTIIKQQNNEKFKVKVNSKEHHAPISGRSGHREAQLSIGGRGNGLSKINRSCKKNSTEVGQGILRKSTGLHTRRRTPRLATVWQG